MKYLILELNRILDIASERGSELRDRSEELARVQKNGVEDGLGEAKNRFWGCSDYRSEMVVMSWAKVLPVKMEKSGWVRMKFRIPCISGWKEKEKNISKDIVLWGENKGQWWKLETSWFSHIIRKFYFSKKQGWRDYELLWILEMGIWT